MSDACKTGPAGRPRKSAVILAGAAGKGPFAAGALGVVTQHLAEFEIVCVVGTSSGALNAAVFAAGLRVGRAKEAAQRLETLWRDTANFFDICTMQKRVNIVKNALREFTQYPQTFPIKLRIAMTTLDGNEAFANHRHYTTHETIRHFEGVDFASEKGIDEIASYATASAAIPFIFRPVRIDGTTYVDGGIVDNAPIGWALRQDAAIEDLIVVTSAPRVAARPRHIGRLPFGPVLNVITEERLTRDLLEAYSFNHELKQLEAMGVDMRLVRRELKWRQLKIVEIRPPRETPGGLVSGFFCRSQRIDNLNAGKDAAARALEERLQCPVVHPAPPPAAAPIAQSQHLRKSTELLLIAPIKKGLVPVPFTITYAVRLKMLLEGLFSLRQAGVERFAGLATLVGPLEAVTSLHFVQWAIIDGGTRLLLAVTFEGPWEAYIRGIVDNAGPFLDSIFCHCEGYTGGPESHATADGYDGFARWVREHQVPVSFLHSAAPDISANDIVWLRKLAELRPKAPGATFAEESTELWVPSPPGPDAPIPPSTWKPAKKTTFVQVLSAFFQLGQFFPPPDDVFLQRSAAKQLYLLIPKLAPDKKQPGALQDAWDWYEKYVLPLQLLPPPAKPVSTIAAPGTVQANILTSYVGMADGLVVFLQFEETMRQATANFVGSFSPTIEEEEKPTFARNIALTFTGFQSLGLGDLADFPEEFREGMEARAPMLGDVGVNHPYFWERPIAYGTPPDTPNPPRIDLSTIDAVVSFQWAQGEKGARERALAEIQGRPGVHILATQNLHRKNTGKDFVAPFGFVDGLSQPVPLTPASVNDGKPDRDKVALGEVLLGYKNAKRECLRYQHPDVFMNGSFLAMRKIRQDVAGFEHLVDPSGTGYLPNKRTTKELTGKIMGRHRDGTPLAAGGARTPSDNDFDYSKDLVGKGCPLSAHVRRANPRMGEPPRIMRRGFSYHDGGQEDGIVFMAYCGSLGSQYEVVQKWVNGGNSTGTYGAQVDPMAAVNGISDSSFFYPDSGGVPVQVPMPAHPLLSLKWGLYLFAPSTTGLAAITTLALAAMAPKAAPAPGRCPLSGATTDPRAAMIAAGRAQIEQLDEVDPATALDKWREWVEEQDVPTQQAAGAVFAALRTQPGFDLTPYGILLSRGADHLAVFSDRDYSVREYGKRMTRSFGMLTLGLDPEDGYEAAATAPNAFLSSISRVDAYEAAFKVGGDIVAQALQVDQPGPRQGRRRIIDLGQWADLALCKLVEIWFGFPDPTMMKQGTTAEMSGDLPCCPDDFRVVSGYIFPPNPTVAQTQAAVVRGALIAKAGAAFTSARRAALAGGDKPANTLIDTLISSGYMNNDDDATSRAWIGAVSGFTVPTGGSFERCIGAWLEQDLFWRIQEAYAARDKTSLDFIDETKNGFLAGAVIETFQNAPVPYALHRRVKQNREVSPGITATPDTPVVMLTTSAGQELAARPSFDTTPIFGGAFDPAKPTGSALHACPGRKIALGVMMGLAASLFELRNVTREAILIISFDA